MEVQPIKDPKKISAMAKILRAGQSGPRNELLFLFGINTALRIGDLLGLRIADVVDRNWKIKEELELREQKTGKSRKTPLNKVVKEALKKYLDHRRKSEIPLAMEAPLFLSRTGEAAITRQRAHRIMADAGLSVGLADIGTHSLRKTFGYHVFKKTGGNLALVQKLLNHSSSGDTLRYIGIDREQLDNTYRDLNLS
jgi:integrase